MIYNNYDTAEIFPQLRFLSKLYFYDIIKGNKFN